MPNLWESLSMKEDLETCIKCRINLYEKCLFYNTGAICINQRGEI